MKPVLTTGEEKRWTVYVGGMEVNDFILTFQTAERLGLSYLDDKYDDIVLKQLDTGEEVRII